MGAIVPFLTMIAAPEMLLEHPMIKGLSLYLGLNSVENLRLPITLIFVFAALSAGGVRVLLLWANTRLSYAVAADISVEAYKRTLYQPYKTHLDRSSGDVISGIVMKINSATAVINLTLLLVSSTILALFIISILIAIDPIVTITAAVFFGLCYFTLSLVTRYRIRRNSERIAQGTTDALKALQQGLGGIRDVLLGGTQSFYCKIYEKAERPTRLAQGNNVFIAGSPRFVLEALGMVFIALFAYWLSTQSGGVSSAIPILGAFAFGAQRLLPLLQNVYSSIAGISGHKSSLLAVIKLLDQELPVLEVPSEPPRFTREVTLNSIYFRFNVNTPWLLEDFTLAIPKGSRIGIVGVTGSGKTTTLDLLMGFLRPERGEILLDGKVVSCKGLRAWQSSIAHVPQNIFLADSSIAENIAFGVPVKEIDWEKIKTVAEQAKIMEFINEAPDGLRTMVGEYGMRLSGGQRQRIGIARALYKNTEVLILDEATSALDGITEKEIMQSLSSLGNNLTVLTIAHRISTIQRCDSIIQLENGRVVGQGSYEQLLEHNEKFKKLAGKMS